MTGKVRDRQTYSVCFQVSSTWGLLLLLNRMCVVGPCTFEAPSRLTLVSTAVWPAALLEPPLRLLLWMLEVRQHFSFYTILTSQIHTKENSSSTIHSSAIFHSTVGPLFSEAPVDVTANVGENISLPCVVRGFPQPSVTWHRQDGRQILTRADRHSRTMQLENGHLLIQSELSMKHYHSKELWTAMQGSTAPYSPCTE